MERKALQDLSVIETGGTVAAAYCGKLLGDMGADVTKVEPPGGDALRHHGPVREGAAESDAGGLFAYLNTSKRSITLDLEQAPGVELLQPLLATADIVVTHLPPGDAERRGLSAAALRSRHPHLIVAAISPFGQTGPYRDHKAYEITCQAAGGLMTGIGSPGRPPLKLPLTQTGYQAGLAAAIGALAAACARRRGQPGQEVDVSEAEVWATMHVGTQVVNYLFRHRFRRRAGHRLLGQPFPHEIFPCKDGFVAIQASERQHFQSFVEMVGSPPFLTDGRFGSRMAMNEKHGDEVDALLAPWFLARTKDEILALCRRHRIAGAPVYTAREVLEHPHLRERAAFVPQDHPTLGTLPLPRSPYRLTRTPAFPSSPAPRPGQHNDEVYRSRLGLAPEALAALRQAGVV